MADTILKLHPKDDGAAGKRKRSLIGFARARLRAIALD